MKEEENKLILDRKESMELVEIHFKDQIQLLQEIVNYGTNLIPRCVKSSKREMHDIFILIVLLKHVVAMIDSVEIQISQGSILGANLPARSLFETSLYIDWILKKDTKRRANQYYVWHLRQNRRWIKRMIEGDIEKEEFLKKLNLLEQRLVKN